MGDCHPTRRAETAPGSAHALDLEGLKSPAVSVGSAWDGDAWVGVGAHGPGAGSGARSEPRAPMDSRGRTLSSRGAPPPAA